MPTPNSISSFPISNVGLPAAGTVQLVKATPIVPEFLFSFSPSFLHSSKDEPFSADEPTILAVNSAMQGREKKSKDSYHQYEALRNIHRDIRLYSTRYEPMATILPAFWLLYRRMWEPLGVVVITYAIALFIQPGLFVLVYLLLSVYFHKAQTDMVRSHCLYHEYYFWMIFAASSTREAQELLRVFDLKCQFEFSHVGPPEKTDSKAAANSSSQIDSEARADIPA